MNSWRRFRLIVLLSIGYMAVMAWFCWPIAAHEVQEPKKPKLAVLVVFDQLRGDYLSRWQHLYDKQGFGRLQKEGAWFQNCHYPYAYTLTAAGHASMSTGCSPNKHGIIGNSWYDRKMGDEISSVQSEKHALVPEPPDKKQPGAAPTRLKQPTVGDALMDQTNGKAKVVSISIKDRAAILLAALRAALAAWLNPSNGMMTTSTFYNGGQMPGWLTAFNKSRQVDKWFDEDWNRLRPNLNYAYLAGPDNFKYEGTGYKQGKTFPHPLHGGAAKPGRDYYYALANSPFGNELVLQLGKMAIVEEKLGQDDVPDLLCLSFSSNDYIGHCWGPDSQEVLDVTLRSDLIIKDLLNFLDDKVGQGQYMLVLCADHGVCPLPEVMKGKGYKDVGRVPYSVTGADATAFLNATFGKGQKHDWILYPKAGVYLNRGTIEKLGLKQETVENALAHFFAQQRGIAKVYTRSQLLAGHIKNDPMGEMLLRSFNPENSGDVFPILKPHYLFSNPLSLKDTGTYTTTHGTPYEYDTHVPLMVFGANVQPGIRKDRVTPQAVASILAAGLGIQPPSGAEAPVPKNLWK